LGIFLANKTQQLAVKFKTDPFQWIAINFVRHHVPKRYMVVDEIYGFALGGDMK
jgi:hypothetical protein